MNYGLCKKNNIVWGKPKGSEYRTYFIERPFNYTNLVLEQIKEIKKVKCINCGKIFSEEELDGLKFTKNRCFECFGNVIEEIIVDNSILEEIKDNSELPLLSKVELEILFELNSSNKFMLAREIAEEVDVSSQRVWRICKKMESDGLVDIKKGGIYLEYRITNDGKIYCQ